ncbi:hypothetical protein KZO25_03320, partial [Halomonas sp. ANAO-440]|uniref:hypothetical protein n=1 Tax=Halomonas sp. ANAO-440 TaxID=2861360 RepID=UPI001CAA670D
MRNIRWCATGYWLILALGLSVLAVLLGLVLAVDVFHHSGLVARLEQRQWHADLVFWRDLFAEGGPAEVLQWLMLGLAAGLAWNAAGWLRGLGGHPRLSTFWLLMGTALVLMLIEDAGNMRTAVHDYTSLAFGMRAAALGEYAIFAVLALLPALTLLWHWRLVWQLPRTRILLLAAFAAYGFAGIGSALRRAWYEPAGWWLHDRIFGGQLTELPGICRVPDDRIAYRSYPLL